MIAQNTLVAAAALGRRPRRLIDLPAQCLQERKSSSSRAVCRLSSSKAWQVKVKVRKVMLSIRPVYQ